MPRNHRSPKPICVLKTLGLSLLCALAAASCTPASQMSRICKPCSSFTLESSISPLRVWARNLPNDQSSQALAPSTELHIYLENDGAAFLSPTQVAANPSLRAQLLVLHLMQLDRNPSLYITRPCYGFAFDALPASCTPGYWTQARYSAEVVQALSQAIDHAKQKLNQTNTPLVLIGHSGGGSLALLIAHTRQDVRKVITLAGNLDTDAWAEFHGYNPLAQSLNPIKQPLLPPSVARWHFAGEQDRVVPPPLINAACAQDPAAHCVLVPLATHTEGWQAQWPSLLETTRATP
ncbi:MAG: alpha/beta fold hydrolase [Marinagarivorans sp.]